MTESGGGEGRFEPHMIFLGVVLGALFVATLIASVIAGIHIKRGKMQRKNENVIGGAFKASSVNLEQFPPLQQQQQQHIMK